MTRRTLSLIVLGSAALLVPTLALTQDAPRERRGGFDPARMRERQMDNIKEQLGTSEDEWKALAPKIEKILDAQRDLRGGMGRFGGPGGGGGPGGPGGPDQPMGKVAEAQRDLRDALQNKDTPAEEVTKKLTAYREARDKARAELQAAQKDLTKQIKPRQEAVLVVAGVLE